MAELMLFLLLMAVGGIVWSLRDNTNPATLWTWGWLILAATSVFLVYGDALPWAGSVSLLTSALLPAFLYAGARAYVDRPAPHWLLPAALMLGAFRWSLAQSEIPLSSHLIGMVAEPAVELAAAYLVLGVARAPGATLSQKLLVPAMASITVVDGLTALVVYRGEPFPGMLSIAWYAVGLLTFGFQMTAAGHRSRALRARLLAESERTREALRESQERFEVLTENATDVITEMNAEGRVLYISPSCDHVLGRPPEALVGSLGIDIVHPDDRTNAVRSLIRSVETDTRATALIRCRHADGSWRWIEANCRAFWSAGGERRLVAVARDVTERHQFHESLQRSHESLERRVEERTAQLKTLVSELEKEVEARRRAEDELRESRERYRMVSEISSDFGFCFRLSPDGSLRTEWVTDSFTRLMGYAVEDVQGVGWLQLLDPEFRETAIESIRQVVSEGSLELEQSLVTRAGERRWLHSRITGRHLEDSDDIQVVGASRDVTEQHQADAERRRLQTHLNDVQRLESLGVLAGGIAHDFNNLLSVILGNISLLIHDAADSPDVDRRLVRIRMAAQHAARLTEQMLTYSGKTPFSLKPVDLSSVVEETRDLLEATVSKRCRLEIHCDGAPIRLDGDETQLRQVLVNLVSNAAEAMGDRGGGVHVRTGTTEITADEIASAFGAADTRPGEHVYLEVADDGPGIDEASRERIFDPFFSTRRSGRGLGLATVLGIVRGHGGFIQLESEAGHGSVFRAVFPRSGATTEQPVTATTAAPPQDTPATVLVIDDEEDVLELASEFLRRAGFDVLAARGGEQGIAILERSATAIDLVVLDLVMPGVGGEETFRRIRAFDPGLPVLLMSGYDEERTVERFSSDEFLGFLGKPYEPNELIWAVKASLDR